MNRALVTGGSGFVGSHLCRRLVDRGVELHAVSRQPLKSASLRWWQADVSHPEAVAEIVERVQPDVIFHLAGFPWGTRDLDAVMPSVRDSVLGATNVFVSAARVGALVVVAGSMEEPQGPASIPASPYAAAKQAIGSYARMLHALHGLNVVVLRLFMIYGPAHEDYNKLLPYVVTSLLRGERPKLSSATRPVDWVYVSDVVDAFVAAASSKRTWQAETLDIGSGELVTIREIVMRVVEMIGAPVDPEFGAIPDRPLETTRAADIGRTEEILGWTPRTSLPDGLRATIDWYRENALGVSNGDRKESA